MARRFHPYTSLLLCVGAAVVLGGGYGCTPESKIKRAAPPIPEPEPLITSKSPQTAVPSATPIKFQVKVDSPIEDLKVRIGAFIRKGQVVARPDKKRTALNAKKQELEFKLEDINRREGSSALFPVVQQQAEIAQVQVRLAQQELEYAQAELQNYQKNSPWTDYARSILPIEEEEELKQLTTRVQQAQANLENAKAQYVEQQSAQTNQQQIKSQEKQIVQKGLAQVESELSGLKPTTSAHTGTVTKIDVAKVSSGQPVTVTISLLPGETPAPTSNSDIPLDTPSGLTRVPSQSGTGSAIDPLPSSPSSSLDLPASNLPSSGLPSSDLPSSVTIPKPSDIPSTSISPSTSPSLPDRTPLPNVETE